MEVEQDVAAPNNAGGQSGGGGGYWIDTWAPFPAAKIRQGLGTEMIHEANDVKRCETRNKRIVSFDCLVT